MSRTVSLDQKLRQIQIFSASIGVFCLAIAVIGAFRDSQSFFRNYLFGYLFWFQIGIGSTGILMITVLTGGRWGSVTRPILEAANRTHLLLTILFAPVLIGLNQIYPWTSKELMESDEILHHKTLYLNAPFFIARTVLYFLSWNIVSRLLSKWIDESNAESKSIYEGKLKSLSAGSLVLLGFSVSFASIDWQMSLEPSWHSTIYGMIFGVGQMLAAWGFTVFLFTSLVQNAGLTELLKKKTMRDLGNILLTFVMVWAYLSFMQYLIIWSGNLPDEVTWAKTRTSGGWQWLALMLVAFQFGAPFFLLLFRPIKTHPRALEAVALCVVLINIVDRYWQAVPAFQNTLTFSWFALANFLGIGGIWFSAFLSHLRKDPIDLSSQIESVEISKESLSHV